MTDLLSKLSKSFYFIAGALFIVWMLFLDSNDLYSQYKLNKKLRDLESDRTFYAEKVEEVRKDREELTSNKELLEKFAREKYLMKKESEDLYVIVEKEK